MFGNSGKKTTSAYDTILLQKCVEEVLRVVSNYEASGNELHKACAGSAWSKLRELAETIQKSLSEEKEEGEKAKVLHEGCGTLGLVQLALHRLGGKATSTEVRDWIENNKTSPAVKNLGCKLNEKATTARDRQEGTKVWHLTVSSCLSEHKGVHWQLEKKDGVNVWSALSSPPDAKRRRTQ